MTKNREPTLFEAGAQINIPRRRMLAGTASGAVSLATGASVFAQSVIKPAPSAPEGDWRTKEAAEEQRKILEKIRLEDERLAKLPKDQRVLRPKNIELNGKKYIELDMYGTRFRIPREYVGQLPPDGQFVDGRFWWPQKIGLDDPQALKYYPRYPSGDAKTEAEFAESRKRNLQIIKYWISARRYGIKGDATVRDPRRFEKIQADIAGVEFFRVAGAGVPYWGHIVPDKIVKTTDGWLMPDGKTAVLWLRDPPISKDFDRVSAVYRGGFEYRGLGVSYFLSLHLLPQWKEIHTEVLGLLNQWTKE